MKSLDQVRSVNEVIYASTKQAGVNESVSGTIYNRRSRHKGLSIRGIIH